MSNIQSKLKQVKEDFLGNPKQQQQTTTTTQGETRSADHSAPKSGFDSGDVHGYDSGISGTNATTHDHRTQQDSNYTHSGSGSGAGAQYDTSPTFAPKFDSQGETIDSIAGSGTHQKFHSQHESQSANPNDFRTTSEHGQKYSSLLDENEGVDVADSNQGVKDLNLDDDDDYGATKGKSSLDPALKSGSRTTQSQTGSGSGSGSGVAETTLGAAAGAGAIAGAGAGYIATLSSYIPGFGSSDTNDTSNTDQSQVDNIRVRSDDTNLAQGSGAQDYSTQGYGSQTKSQGYDTNSANTGVAAGSGARAFTTPSSGSQGFDSTLGSGSLGTRTNTTTDSSKQTSGRYNDDAYGTSQQSQGVGSNDPSLSQSQYTSGKSDTSYRYNDPSSTTKSGGASNLQSTTDKHHSSSKKAGGLDYDQVQSYATQGGQKGEAYLGKQGQGEAGKYVGLAGAGVGAGAGYLGAKGAKGSNTTDSTNTNYPDSSTQSSGAHQTQSSGVKEGLGIDQGKQSLSQSQSQSHSQGHASSGSTDYNKGSRGEELHIPGTFVTDNHSQSKNTSTRSGAGSTGYNNDATQGGQQQQYSSSGKSDSHAGGYAAGGAVGGAAVGATAGHVHDKKLKAAQSDLDDPNTVFTGTQDANYKTAQNAERDAAKYRAKGGDKHSKARGSGDEYNEDDEYYDDDDEDLDEEGNSKGKSKKSGGLLSTLGLKKKEKPANDDSTDMEKGAQKRNYGADSQGRSGAAGYTDNSKSTTKPAKEELKSSEVDPQGFREVGQYNDDVSRGQKSSHGSGSAAAVGAVGGAGAGIAGSEFAAGKGGGVSSKSPGKVTSHGARFDPPTSGAHSSSASAQAQSQAQGYNTSGTQSQGYKSSGTTGSGAGVGAGVGAATGLAAGSTAHGHHGHNQGYDQQQQQQSGLSHQKASDAGYVDSSGRGTHQAYGTDYSQSQGGGLSSGQQQYSSKGPADLKGTATQQKQSSTGRDSAFVAVDPNQYKQSYKGASDNASGQPQYIEKSTAGHRQQQQQQQQQQHGAHDNVSSAQFAREGDNNFSSVPAAEYPQQSGGHQKHHGSSGVATGVATGIAAGGISEGAYSQQPYGTHEKTKGAYAQDPSGHEPSSGQKYSTGGASGLSEQQGYSSGGHHQQYQSKGASGQNFYGQDDLAAQGGQYDSGAQYGKHSSGSGYNSSGAQGGQYASGSQGAQGGQYASGGQGGQYASGSQGAQGGQYASGAQGVQGGQQTSGTATDYSKYQKYAEDGGKQGQQFLEKQGQGEAGKYVGVAGATVGSGVGYIGGRSAGKQQHQAGGNSNLSPQDNDTARKAADNALHSNRGGEDTTGNYANAESSGKKEGSLKGMIKKVFN